MECHERENNGATSASAEHDTGLRLIQGLPYRPVGHQEYLSGGSAVIAGHARAHFGDSINNYFYEADRRPVDRDLRKEKFKILHQSLFFARINARERNIAAAAPGTCVWIYEDSRFRAWVDDKQNPEHFGFLWIRGKPGTGKSTLVKNLRQWAENQWSGQITVSYFFNARSPNELEKSTLGLYRTLVYQLLLANRDCRDLFLRIFATKERYGDIEEWEEPELQNFLIQLFCNQENGVSSCAFNVFIDALDEGKDDDVQQMVAFFEDLAFRSISTGGLLRICLSSRHYPHIHIRYGLSIIMEDQQGHRLDIESYIRNRLPENTNEEMATLQLKMLQRANGVFLWVVLVIPILLRAHNQGESIASMTRSLESVPQNLHDLFAALLSRDLDAFDECIALLQWVLCSFQHLTPQMLYAAVKQLHQTAATLLECTVDNEIRKRYILNCSRGLVEFVVDATAEQHLNRQGQHRIGTSKNERPATIQFIHETVRDFLTRTSTHMDHSSVLHNGHSMESSFQLKVCHRVLARSCLQNLVNASNCESPNADLLALTSYAAKNWWRHLTASEEECDPELIEFAITFISKSKTLKKWIQRDFVHPPWSILSRSGMPRQRLNAKPYCEPENALYYVALKNMSQLVPYIVASEPNVDTVSQNSNIALQIAALLGHSQTVKALLQVGTSPNYDPHGQYNCPLWLASCKGHEKVAKLLLDAGADVNAVDVRATEKGCAIQAAAKHGHTEIVRMLIDRGACIDNGKLYNSSALHLASSKGYEDVVQLLLSKEGINGTITDDDKGLSLIEASTRGSEDMARMLLSSGADVNFTSNSGKCALMEAITSHSIRVVKLLIASGANVIVKSSAGTALRLAAMWNSDNCLALLLGDKRSTDFDSPSHLSEALIQAVGYDRISAVDLLLARGAEVDYVGLWLNKKASALDVAVSDNNTTMVNRLRAAVAVKKDDGANGPLV